jgi:hypothetical protein
VGTTDIGAIVGPLVDVLKSLATNAGIPIPLPVWQKVKPFGDKYTSKEPIDPVDRGRWSQQCSCMRLNEKYWESLVF